MIVWIHGAFGAGKSSVSREVQALVTDGLLFDPELVGFMLREILPVPTGDFQDLPEWRKLVIATGAALDARAAGPVLAPMTFLNRRYADEVIYGLTDRSVHLRQVLLDIEIDELRRRIRLDAPVPGEPAANDRTRAWRLSHIEAYAAARSWLVERADFVVDVTHRQPAAAARHLLAGLGLVESAWDLRWEKR